MVRIDYSVIIRTTGNAHEKYQRLLDSIKQLIPQPKEVIVVLPEGYALPNERLGYERFLFSQKGMVRQRMFGIASCNTEYALICDDDVSFSPDFVTKLHAPLAEGKANFSAAPLYSFLPSTFRERFLCALMASAVPALLRRKTRYITVLRSTGYSYNCHLDRFSTHYYETQSAPWTCFYAHIPSLRLLDFEKETWLDANGYSAMDDQTMFYKAWLMGMKTLIVSDANYEHLDGKTSTINNRPAVVYSAVFNRVVFMHRFLYSQKRFLGKAAVLIAFAYFCAWAQLRNEFSSLRGRMSKENCNLSRKAYRDAGKYLRSEAYRALPQIARK